MRPNNQPPLSDEDFENEIFQHLKNMGLAFPESSEEFEQFFVMINQEKIPVPIKLPTAADILKTGYQRLPDKLNESTDETIEDYLAQAAREGKGISKEVEDEMNKDREKSRKSSQDGEE